MALLLFDIDGTLLRPLGVGRRAFEDALLALHGRIPEGSGFSYAGLLDTQIAAATLAALGLPNGTPAVKRLLGRYVDCLKKNPWPQREACLCPGVPGILDEARGRGHRIALLTGNLHEGARVKLGACGILDYFAPDGREGSLLGAFADDAEERHGLVPIAVERCRRRFGEPFTPHETWIVGDSPRDVQAARLSGIRCAAVATGFTDLEGLRSLGPDLAVADLSGNEAFFRSIQEAA